MMSVLIGTNGKFIQEGLSELKLPLVVKEWLMIVCQHECPVGFDVVCPKCTAEEWQECLDFLQECLNDSN